jgi:hypothetical protein
MDYTHQSPIQKSTPICQTRNSWNIMMQKEAITSEITNNVVSPKLSSQKQKCITITRTLKYVSTSKRKASKYIGFEFGCNSDSFKGKKDMVLIPQKIHNVPSTIYVLELPQLRHIFYCLGRLCSSLLQTHRSQFVHPKHLRTWRIRSIRVYYVHHKI